MISVRPPVDVSVALSAGTPVDISVVLSVRPPIDVSVVLSVRPPVDVSGMPSVRTLLNVGVYCTLVWLSRHNRTYQTIYRIINLLYYDYKCLCFINLLATHYGIYGALIQSIMEKRWSIMKKIAPNFNTLT